ncbi:MULTISPECIES: hypothetical protein [Bacillus]|uniref:Uncharacterized protein n=1 Tax=Bacillus glycinifermentans TaxID=1664069 RepID=A0AAJ3YYJ2_9BACI|nr:MULTISPECIES: hypothetical protein [Bacillus]HWO76400.1 hypothetical protein [Bacillus sp. (in: firmicutes)]KKB71678.1 hypothetical protein TH62_21080 [Bacillus sp. TH008]MBU8785253.1 hypothetical protein [Bacillus glycinifermentans]MDU0069715.1 hypothetical protein [Bacillus sp. IG6]MED8018002.1 hypothetical protein [Bacillus glycinifermentans]
MFKKIDFVYLEIIWEREAFKYFEEKKLYPDMEGYGICIGDVLSEKQGDILGANEFYRKAIASRKKFEGEVF